MFDKRSYRLSMRRDGTFLQRYRRWPRGYLAADLETFVPRQHQPQHGAAMRLDRAGTIAAGLHPAEYDVCRTAMLH